MTPIDPEHLRNIVDELANTLQTAVMLAGNLATSLRAEASHAPSVPLWRNAHPVAICAATLPPKSTIKAAPAPQFLRTLATALDVLRSMSHSLTRKRARHESNPEPPRRSQPTPPTSVGEVD